MKYTKITKANAHKLLVQGSIAVHCNSERTENELDELEYDDEIEIVSDFAGSIGVRFLDWTNPDSKNMPPTIYNESVFSEGYWWIKK